MTAVGARVWCEAQRPIPEEPYIETVAYGFGTYLGKFPYEGKSQWGKKGVLNPKIQLDRGGFVYGCECWWFELDEYQEAVCEVPKDLEYLKAPHDI